MVWIVGAVCMILFGGGIGVIGLSLGMLGYAILGGVMALYGIFLLMSFRRKNRYWGVKRT
jgi:hypothetical protein